LVLRPLIGLLYQSRMIDNGDCGAVGGMRIGKGNRSTRKNPCPSATLSTTKVTRPDLGTNTGYCGGEKATNHLGYSTASCVKHVGFEVLAAVVRTGRHIVRWKSTDVHPKHRFTHKRTTRRYVPEKRTLPLNFLPASECRNMLKTECRNFLTVT
jgi:hypothetical protein